MKHSFLSIIRDIFLLCALFFLVKTAFERTFSFLETHKESMIHELDSNFLDQIYTTQRQLNFLEHHPVHGDTFANEIAELKTQLRIVEEKYKKNSPVLLFLGPIGTASVIAKEQQLQLKLLAIINDLRKIFAKIDNSGKQFVPATTINSGLDINKQSLQTLIT